MGQREDRPGLEQDMEHLAVVDKLRVDTEQSPSHSYTYSIVWYIEEKVQVKIRTDF